VLPWRNIKRGGKLKTSLVKGWAVGRVLFVESFSKKRQLLRSSHLFSLVGERGGLFWAYVTGGQKSGVLTKGA